MDCDRIRAALSARLDGEDPGMLATTIDDHVAGCADCAAWAGDVASLHRLVRVQPADDIPDLSAAIVAAATSAPRARGLLGREPVSAARWGLLVLALTQLVLAAPGLLVGDAGDVGLHAARELGAFDVALAVGLLVAAWQPARAWGLLPLVAALALVMGGAAVVDVVRGAATVVDETPHLLELAGVVLLSRVAHEPSARAGGRVRAVA